jgi:hypothetical protein
MPFTPFHMGPGLLIKSVLLRHFSLMVFGFSQVAMDIETLIRILRGDAILHGFTHTYLGATVIALISFLIGRPICQWFLNLRESDPNFPFVEWLFEPRVISKSSAIVGAGVGTYSHVLLDSVMHFDVRPFAPWIETNPLIEVISVRMLHLVCITSGMLGGILLLVSYFLRKR